MKVPTLVNIKDVKSTTLYKPTYIGLGSYYGNQWSQVYPRKRAIREYEDVWRAHLFGPHTRYRIELQERLADLDGATLLCHCYPKPCHGDVLIKLFKEVFRDIIGV